MSVELTWMLLGILLMLFTIPGNIEILVLTTASIFWKKKRSMELKGNLNIAVVIPAHNEEMNVLQCIQSLQACEHDEIMMDIVVVADNCEDCTAQIAQTAGVRVLERKDTDNKGKGQALKFAFQRLIKEDFDVFIVVDADSVVEKNLIRRFDISFRSGSDAVQCRYLPTDSNRSIHSRLMKLAFAGFHVVRPRGRNTMGFSAGIFGNGFGMTKKTLERVPYEAGSIVEDLEYHLALVRRGVKVVFEDKTTVRADFCGEERTASIQRARWEGGRFRIMSYFIPQLLSKVFRWRNRLIEPLFDLLTLPLSYHILLLLFTALVPYGITRTYAVCGIGVVGFHVLTAIVLAGTSKDLLTLFIIPFYILWKLVKIPLILKSSRRDAPWVRTPREDSDASGSA